MSGKQQNGVDAWRFQEVLLETYAYAPGQREDVPRHTHEEYQFGLNLTHTGTYRYRGADHFIPVGSLSVLHPGEPHATRSSRYKTRVSRHRMLFLPSRLFQQVAAELAERPVPPPFFPDPILVGPEIPRLFLRLHRTLEAGAASLLEQESLLLRAIARLIARHAQDPPAPRLLAPSDAALRRVRDYLRENYADNVSLRELARLADLSPSHLSVAFRQRFGVPPHAYQIQTRIDTAKFLLASGAPSRSVAAETGFVDQSHFGYHFKRLVTVTPGRYKGQLKQPLVQAPQNRSDRRAAGETNA